MSADDAASRDLVVVIPGIMGSELVDAQGRPVWSLSAGSLVRAIRTFGRSVRSLTLPPDIGDAPPGDGVRAVRLMPGLHVIPGVWSPVAGYSRTIDFLRSGHLGLTAEDDRSADRIPNLVTFPYDWRLSNRYNGRLLAKKAGDALARWQTEPGMRDAKLVLVCHSMGGLVARWFLEREGGAALTRHLITIGTPHRGSVKSLDKLVNGVEPGVGPFRFKLHELVRSLPSMYQLLPTYDCLEAPGGGRRALTGAGLADLDSKMLADSVEFHAAINGDHQRPYTMHKVVGTRQPTPTTARVTAKGLETSFEIDGSDQGGDGTVPRLSAEPSEGRGSEVHEVAEQHGELHGVRSTLDLVDGIVSREELIWEGTYPEAFGVSMAELWAPDTAPELVVPDLGDRRLRVTVLDEQRERVGTPVIVQPDGRAVLDPLLPGGYEARVESPVPGGPPAVTRPFLVWDPTEFDDLPTGTEPR
ncbi:hypothetical protein AB0E69_28005 [Kribbella sp. NPDC026611]|uniref:esterase/lipase family protein n=1 Tax=Kribbella sp. NPDC026611 TaxID=3154911 RepID=UPI0034005C2E